MQESKRIKKIGYDVSIFHASNFLRAPLKFIMENRWGTAEFIWEVRKYVCAEKVSVPGILNSTTLPFISLVLTLLEFSLNPPGDIHLNTRHPLVHCNDGVLIMDINRVVDFYRKAFGHGLSVFPLHTPTKWTGSLSLSTIPGSDLAGQQECCCSPPRRMKAE